MLTKGALFARLSSNGGPDSTTGNRHSTSTGRKPASQPPPTGFLKHISQVAGELLSSVSVSGLVAFCVPPTTTQVACVTCEGRSHKASFVSVLRSMAFCQHCDHTCCFVTCVGRGQLVKRFSHQASPASVAAIVAVTRHYRQRTRANEQCSTASEQGIMVMALVLVVMCNCCPPMQGWAKLCHALTPTILLTSVVIWRIGGMSWEWSLPCTSCSIMY